RTRPTRALRHSAGQSGSSARRSSRCAGAASTTAPRPQQVVVSPSATQHPAPARRRATSPERAPPRGPAPPPGAAPPPRPAAPGLGAVPAPVPCLSAVRPGPPRQTTPAPRPSSGGWAGAGTMEAMTMDGKGPTGPSTTNDGRDPLDLFDEQVQAIRDMDPE